MDWTEVFWGRFLELVSRPLLSHRGRSRVPATDQKAKHTAYTKQRWVSIRKPHIEVFLRTRGMGVQTHPPTPWGWLGGGGLEGFWVSKAKNPVKKPPSFVQDKYLSITHQ